MSLDPIAYQPYSDPDEFIREVTDRIWVGRDIDHIIENYEEDSIVHGSLGTTVGRQGVIDGTTMRIATVPQHVGVAEDVIWEQRGEDAFLSSHLVFSSDEHIVDGRLRRVRSRTVANCLYRRGRMVEEWVVRDSLADCLQRGIPPEEAAAEMRFVGHEGSWTQQSPADPLRSGESGPRPSTANASCAMVLDMIEEVWNKRRLDQVHEYMVRDLFLHTVGDSTVLRPEGYQKDLLSLIAPFTDCRFSVRDVQAHDHPDYAGLRVAVLWQMTGVYAGVPSFGPLTNAPVDLMGVSQFLIQNGRIVREIRVYDEIALRAQIAVHQDENSSMIGTNIY
ncbi:ester cyclase [Brachybacterium sp.]|uniref:nuclear transport factor 2 family protein n=1 Tax=Brachybacterium sp. TaxID=1891286 RepID=UPI002ED20E7E